MLGEGAGGRYRSAARTNRKPRANAAKGATAHSTDERTDGRPVNGDAGREGGTYGREHEDLDRRSGDGNEVVDTGESEGRDDDRERDSEGDGAPSENAAADGRFDRSARQGRSDQGERCHQKEGVPRTDRSRRVGHPHAGAGVVGADAEGEREGGGNQQVRRQRQRAPRRDREYNPVGRWNR